MFAFSAKIFFFFGINITLLELTFEKKFFFFELMQRILTNKILQVILFLLLCYDILVMALSVHSVYWPRRTRAIPWSMRSFSLAPVAQSQCFHHWFPVQMLLQDFRRNLIIRNEVEEPSGTKLNSLADMQGELRHALQPGPWTWLSANSACKWGTCKAAWPCVASCWRPAAPPVCGDTVHRALGHPAHPLSSFSSCVVAVGCVRSGFA